MSVKLTQYSKASGCGCKIAPAVLNEILKDCKQNQIFEKLLVGNQANDDAAIFELDNEQCIISTTDFFTPIVDDAFDFGKISATNAISDVYAMGGKPVMAVAILGWPIEKIPVELAQQVIKGAQEICTLAGIPLAGGHSVDTQEPLFGLAVTGVVKKSHIKKNNTVKQNDLLYLTKPLGLGVLSTALKRGLLLDNEYEIFIKHTTQLNKVGYELGAQPYVHAMTDVTGFGLAGHLLEMLQGANLSATIFKSKVPIMEAAQKYIHQFVMPDNTTRNYNAHAPYIDGMEHLDFVAFCDPQTSGGLLISIDAKHQQELEMLLHQHQTAFYQIGEVTAPQQKMIYFR